MTRINFDIRKVFLEKIKYLLRVSLFGFRDFFIIIGQPNIKRGTDGTVPYPLVSLVRLPDDHRTN